MDNDCVAPTGLPTVEEMEQYEVTEQRQMVEEGAA
jgi:hypothetical protein